MCHESCFAFVRRVLRDADVRGRSVLEVGALDVNGSVRPLVQAFAPADYLGVDIVLGPGVDRVCDVTSLVRAFGPDSFDVVISTELLEHVRDWPAAVSNMKRVLRPGGLLIVTTRSKGFAHHAYPYDFWRYEIDDFRRIFSDCAVEVLESDSEYPGVFLRARKPAPFVENDLGPLALYSVPKDKRTLSISPLGHHLYRVRNSIRAGLAFLCPAPLKRFIKAKLLRRPTQSP